MYKLDCLKKPISVLMASSFLILSVPAFAAEPVGCPTCPQRPTAFEGQKVIEHEVSTKTGTSIVIPAGTSLCLQGVGTAPTCVGNTFRGQLKAPVVIDGVTVIPAGSEVMGEVTAINTVRNTMQIDLQNVSTPMGEKIPLRGEANIARTTGSQVYTATSPQYTTTSSQYVTPQQYVAAGQPAQGQVQMNAGGVGLGMPYLNFGRCKMTGGQKVLAGTLGGAVFGGAVGALSGLVMPSEYSNDIDYNSGTGAARGALWGSIMGAGLGLVTGVIAAAADRDDACVTSTCPVPVSNVCDPCAEKPVVCPIPVTTCDPCAAPAQESCKEEPCKFTNMTTGALEERTVSYPSGTFMGPVEYNLILRDPVTIIKR